MVLDSLRKVKNEKGDSLKRFMLLCWRAFGLGGACVVCVCSIFGLRGDKSLPFSVKGFT